MNKEDISDDAKDLRKALFALRVQVSLHGFGGSPEERTAYENGKIRIALAMTEKILEKTKYLKGD